MFFMHMNLQYAISSLPCTSCKVTLLSESKELEDRFGIDYDALDKVYHSSSRHEMEVNADLMGVDLCNPFVLLFLAKQTTYHHAFWPHTAKRFTAFKNVIRHNKQVRKSLLDGAFLALAEDIYEKKRQETNSSIVWKCTPGRQQELANWEQVISIVTKAIASQENEA